MPLAIDHVAIRNLGDAQGTPSSARIQRKLLTNPEEVRPFTHGRPEIWELGDAFIGKQVFEPGWRWSMISEWRCNLILRYT